MANSVIAIYPLTGRTLYFQVRNGTGQVWSNSSGDFENYAAGNWAVYAQTLVEQAGAKVYVGGLPGGLDPAEQYEIAVFERAGGSPAVGDTPVGAGNSFDVASMAAAAATGGLSSLVEAVNNLSIPTAEDNAGAVLDAAVDGVQVREILSRELAARSKFAVTDNEDGTYKIEWFEQNGTTVSHALRFSVGGAVVV